MVPEALISCHMTRKQMKKKKAGGKTGE